MISKGFSYGNCQGCKACQHVRLAYTTQFINIQRNDCELLESAIKLGTTSISGTWWMFEANMLLKIMLLVDKSGAAHSGLESNAIYQSNAVNQSNGSHQCNGVNQSNAAIHQSNALQQSNAIHQSNAVQVNKSNATITPETFEWYIIHKFVCAAHQFVDTACAGLRATGNSFAHHKLSWMSAFAPPLRFSWGATRSYVVSPARFVFCGKRGSGEWKISGLKKTPLERNGNSSSAGKIIWKCVMKQLQEKR